MDIEEYTINESSEQQYVVEDIITRRALKPDAVKDQDFEYLVKWEGYEKKDNTWTKFDCLNNCDEVLTKFLVLTKLEENKIKLVKKSKKTVKRLGTNKSKHKTSSRKKNVNK